MSEKPILFSTPMVQAILEGRKTQTRRVVKDCPDGFEWVLKKPGDSFINYPDGFDGEAKYITVNQYGLCYAGKLNGGSSPYWESSPYFCPYGRPGDTLWVRETWKNCPTCGLVSYKASASKDNVCQHCDEDLYRWKPSIFMPRWASRITLQITNVRVERLHDISETDCIAEGITDNGDGVGVLNHKYGMQKTLYAELWNTINGKKHPWASNPWVWVIAFEVTK